MQTYDLIVVGGGFSGIAAGMAAARQGVRVLVIEKGNCLGGAATNCLVNPFMGFVTRMNGKNVSIAKGIFEEILEELGCGIEKNLSFEEEKLKLILNRKLQSAGVDILFHARLYDAVVKDGKVKSAKFACMSGTLELSAKYFIDATGDAELAYLAGCSCHVGRESDGLCQPMTLCFRVINVDKEKFYATRDELNKKYERDRKNGKFRNPRENILVFQHPIENVLHFNTTRVIRLNPLDPFDVTKAEIEAREQVFELFEYLKENAEGFENASIGMTAAQIGVRESRMIDGEYMLTKEDVVSCRKFEDAIAACCYDIDIHNPDGSGTSHYFLEPGEYYTIPYRSLLPKDMDNLVVVGRCISCDHDAQASCRLMSTVCCMGEAGGYAASLAIKNNTGFGDIDRKELQKMLKDNHAFIGI